MRILMVCLGNICRSPMAEGLMRRKISEAGLTWIVDSAGTANYHVGASPDHRMIETGNKFGTPIHALKGRQFSINDFDKFDVIYAMDKSNFSNILSLAQTEKQVAKVRLLFDEVFPKSSKEVPDPYYGTMADFESVYHLLDDLTEQIKNKLNNDKTR